WQIVPTALGEMMSKGTPAQSGRMMGALMQMKKLDIAALKKAFDGE
ncbi:MAG: 3-demethylubiquinone-9 3-methyltransferase, partial [Acidobacteria bacterium]|nr:3-demethylubiquinone-9 3-methyltransferase [Acidobacteriota bacterium]